MNSIVVKYKDYTYIEKEINIKFQEIDNDVHLKMSKEFLDDLIQFVNKNSSCRVELL